MERRRFLQISGLIAASAVAGCTDDDDTEFEEGDTNGNGNGSGNGNGNEDDELTEGDVEILEHELVVEEDEFIEEVYVEGIVQNNSGERLDYVEVTVRIYDEDDNQLDSYFTNTTDLDDGGTWAFEVMIFEESEDIASYDIAVEDTVW